MKFAEYVDIGIDYINANSRIIGQSTGCTKMEVIFLFLRRISAVCISLLCYSKKFCCAKSGVIWWIKEQWCLLVGKKFIICFYTDLDKNTICDFFFISTIFQAYCTLNRMNTVGIYIKDIYF